MCTLGCVLTANVESDSLLTYIGLPVSVNLHWLAMTSFSIFVKKMESKAPQVVNFAYKNRKKTTLISDRYNANTATRLFQRNMEPPVDLLGMCAHKS